MSRHLQAVLKAETPQNQRDWKEEGLFDLCYRLLFKYGEAYIVKQFTHHLALFSFVCKCRKKDHDSALSHKY